MTRRSPIRIQQRLASQIPSRIARRMRGERSSAAAGAATSVLSSIDAAGWSAQYATTPPTFTPDNSPATVTASRQGYTSAAATTTYSEAMTLTSRVRQPYTGSVVLTSNTVALHDYLYSTDSISGVTNNSAEISPKPICNWALPDRRVVGNSLTAEVVAFHRNARQGKQVACVVFTATDGTTTVTSTVSTPTVSGQSYDQNPVIVYSGTLDISTLTNAHLVTVNAQAYPWIGAAASVADSSGNTGRDQFSPRYYWKDTAKAAAPPVAYVSSTGSNTTGTWSTNPTTAAGLPFLTMDGARLAIDHATRGVPATGGIADGCEIRFTAGTWAWANSGTYKNQSCADIILTRDPAATASTVIITAGATASIMALGGQVSAAFSTGCTFRGITIQRSGVFGFNQAEWRFENAVYDGNGQTGVGFGATAGGYAGCWGLTFSGSVPGGAFGANNNCKMICLRGMSGTIQGSIDGWFLLGCSLTTPGNMALTPGKSASGQINAFNKFANVSQAIFSVGTAGDVTGAAFVQNLVEWPSTTSAVAIGISPDAQTGNTTHIVCHNNTVAGANAAGRCNNFYDEKQGTNRTHKLHSMVGNIWTQINTKGDWFVYVNGNSSPNPADAPNHVGYFPYLYGVGCRGEFSMFYDAGPGQPYFAQSYGGLGNKLGTTNTLQDPGFTSLQSVTYNGSSYTAGAGGGDYHINVGGAARLMLANPVLAFDFAGSARAAANDTAGCYA